MNLVQSGSLGFFFGCQDNALTANTARSEFLQAAETLLSDSVALHWDVLTTRMRFRPEKQSAIRYLAVDTLSHIVVAARVGLWGALPEGRSVLRGGIESAAQLGSVIAEGAYETVVVEVKAGRFRRVDFKRACRNLGEDGAKLRGLHDRISGTASHSSASRLRLAAYTFEGKDYDRLGFALWPEAAETVMHSCMLLSLYLGRLLSASFRQDRIDVSWEQRLSDLESAFQRICDRFVPLGSQGEAPTTGGSESG